MFSVLVVAALWLHNSGVGTFSAPGGPATSAGRLTGLVASDLLLLQVLMMARIPWVERYYGQDTLARRHRLVGFLSFWLMIGHVLLITVGYAQSGGGGVLHQAWELIVTYPGMLLAASGTALLVLVVVLSARKGSPAGRPGSLPTPITMRPSTSPNAVSKAGAQSTAHTRPDLTSSEEETCKPDPSEPGS